MCGIVGAISYAGGFRIDEPYITRMRDAMVHRGPDGGATWISPDGAVGLGHRRLSIIDLSTVANQPMANEDGQVVVVFNGEIYNHAEIRAELLKLGGHRWKTDHSDTETILHAFEQWGEAAFHRFRGMFAFALWDGRRRELWLVRDRFGVKPLYWSDHHSRVTFASEIKALLLDPEQRRAVDEEALFHYLSFLTTPAPMTLFSGIRKVPAGCYVRISADGSRTEKRWYDAWEHVTPLDSVSEAELDERLRDTLRTAVSLRGVSDVPVGVFLSGGIDSSLNAALFAKECPSRIKTFSIGYHGDYKTYTSELPYARRMAEFVGSEHHEYLISQDDLIGFLPRMIHLQDEPIADPVCVPVHFVSKLARDHGVIVCQVGEGSDELFWGYPTWKLKWQLQRWCDRIPSALLHLGLGALRVAGKSRSHQYEGVRRAAIGQPVFWGGAESFPDGQKSTLLSEPLRRRFAGRSSWEAIAPIHQRFHEKAWERSTLNWMSYLDLNLRLPELLLMRLDKMCMGVSLEGREPFLDHKLVELALGIPERVKTQGGVLKHSLKRSIRGIIPDDIIDRPKQGFGVPVYEWFFDRLGTQVRAELEAFTRDSGLLDPAAVRGVLDRGQGTQAWYLFNLALWWRQAIAGSGVAGVGEAFAR
jgi:asparagine synthase (glutamine-hydrolysing)